MHVLNAKMSASKCVQLFINRHALIVYITVLITGDEAIKQQRSSYHSVMPSTDKSCHCRCSVVKA